MTGGVGESIIPRSLRRSISVSSDVFGAPENLLNKVGLSRDFPEYESFCCKSTKFLEGENVLILFGIEFSGGVGGPFLLVGSSRSIFKTEEDPNVLGSGGGYFGFIPFVLLAFVSSLLNVLK